MNAIHVVYGTVAVCLLFTVTDRCRLGMSAS